MHCARFTKVSHGLLNHHHRTRRLQKEEGSMFSEKHRSCGCFYPIYLDMAGPQVDQVRAGLLVDVMYYATLPISRTSMIDLCGDCRLLSFGDRK